MSDANDKPLDLGSVVEALERIERGYKAMTPTHIRDTAQQAIATLRSTVTPAPVGYTKEEIESIERTSQELGAGRFVPGISDGDPVTPAPVANASDMVGLRIMSDELYHYLLGDGTLEGMWWGEDGPGRRKYWWREFLPEPVQHHAPVAKVVDLRGLKRWDVWAYEDMDSPSGLGLGQKVAFDGDWIKTSDLLTLLAQLPGVEVIK